MEDVELGDKVTVTDPDTGETTVREVAGTIVTEDDKRFVDLTIEGTSGKPEALIATTTHPFWVESEGEWVDAGDLHPGMTLRTPAGETVEVADVRYFEKRQRTHDLTVTGIHSYYVLAGTDPLLVHNCDEKMDFVHGTHSGHADNIATNGLSEEGASAAYHGGSVGKRGNLFTYQVTPTDKDTLSDAATFGANRPRPPGARPSVLIFQMCKCTYNRLKAEGHITTRVTDDVTGRVEHIFGPGAMPHLNLIHRMDL
ncbi:polymorphic toxin-type HINT domain-containing protein [Streptomyces sp. NPDC045431]|uniref:polymorphic toxin-type HINT domain-containing protein n=1 Tax=Streptomyces sp. NPDC045431 TaxID=3155613 RepID=UPI0033C872F9